MGPLAPAQLLISIAGVGAIVALVAALLGRGALRFQSADEVRALLAAEAPGFLIGQLWRDVDGRSALALAAGGTPEVALVFALGQKPVVWRLPPRAVAASFTAGELRVRTHDFTRPTLRLRLPEAEAAAAIAALPGGA